MLPYNLVAAKGSEAQSTPALAPTAAGGANLLAPNAGGPAAGATVQVMSSAGTMMTVAPDGTYVSLGAAVNNSNTQSGTSSSAGAGAANGGSANPQPQQQHTFVRYAPRGGRVHHHLPLNEAQIHAHQLGIAQQFATFALQSGTDLPSYQRHAAAMMGIDPARLNVIDPNRRLDGSEPLLGLMLIKDDNVYSHIELLTKYPHLAPINFTPVSLNPPRSSFLLVTCPERVVHASIKYASFVVEDPALFNRLFNEAFGVGSLYLVFASADAGAFSGIAEVVSPCFETPVVITSNGVTTEAVQQRVRLKWIFVKNIPCFSIPFVKVPRDRLTTLASSNACVVTPLDHSFGSRMLQAFAEHIPAVSILMDFKYYDDAEAKGVLAESGHAQKKAALSQRQQRHGGGGAMGAYRGGGYQNNFNNNNQTMQPQQGNVGGRSGFIPYANRQQSRFQTQPKPYQQQQQQQQQPNGPGGGYHGYQPQPPRGSGAGFRGGMGRGGVRGGGFHPTNPRTNNSVISNSNGNNSNPVLAQQTSGASGTLRNNNNLGNANHNKGFGTSATSQAANRRIESSEGERVKLQSTFTFEPTHKKKQGQAKRALQQHLKSEKQGEGEEGDNDELRPDQPEEEEDDEQAPTTTTTTTTDAAAETAEEEEA